MTNRTRTLSLAMICLMLFSTTLVHAATISTFANGDSEVDVELRNQGSWDDDLSGGISMPAGETVNAAGLIVGTAHTEHNDVQAIDSSLIANGQIWNSVYNGGMTQYSASSDFTVEEESLQLTSLGYGADFESNTEGWSPGANQGVEPFTTNWQHNLGAYGPLPQGCAVGDWCWGTDFENPDYTLTLEDGEYDLVLTSASFFVYPGKADMTFKSFHSLFYRSAGTNQYYYDDCAYVAVKNSTNNVDFQNPVFAPFNIGSTTGVSAGDGLHQLGTSTNQVPSGRCNYLGSNGPQAGDYVLAGNGTTSSNSPSGWSNIEIDLSTHEGRYVQLVFIHEVNPRNDQFPVENMNSGWYVDAVRVGDPLPTQGDVTLSSFAPQMSGQPGFPDGYGMLNLDLRKSSSSDFGVDILDAGTGNVVVDRNGNTLSNLQGSLIELWDIDADAYPLIDLKFTFGSGTARLSSPVLHGFHLGTIVGTTFNNTEGVFWTGGTYGWDKWTSDLFDSSEIILMTSIHDSTYSPSIQRVDFSMPIVAVKPIIADNCGGPNSILGMSLNADDQMHMLTNNQWTELSAPSFTFGSIANYTAGGCEVYSFHLEYRFAHHSRGISLDVAADGDIEWGMLDPGFGRFGRQDMFRSGVVNGINEGSSSSSMMLDVNLQSEGASFLLPKGATVHYAEINFESNSIGQFDLSIMSGNEEEAIGNIDEGEYLVPYPESPLASIQSSIQALLDNPLTPVAWVDHYGNEWFLFRLSIDAPSSSVGSSITFRDLDIVYDWQRAISDSNNIARELNQGVALASAGGVTGDVVVPMRIVGGSGGAISLSSLSVSTTSGYDSTLDDGGISGMYPNGDIIEIVTTHDVSAQGQTLGGASLLFETSTGNMELRWDQMNGSFWEESDEDDKINFMALQSIASTLEGTNAVQLNWRFTVNPSWDDTASVRLYAMAISDTDVSGLPAGSLIQPSVGNAVENDAGIIDFHLFNQGGIEQTDLTNAYSSNTITLDFSTRYEDLDIAPNPTSYQIHLQKRNQSNIMMEEWLPVDSVSPTIDGEFTWQPTLPASEAGNENYRLLMSNYTDGDTICPPAEYNPDSDCAIRFSITLDPFAPHLMNISVFSVQGDWRELGDDTWVRASSNQKFRVAAQDLPLAPEMLTLNYWVEAENDCGLDGLCPGAPSYVSADAGELDREAQLNEYSQVGLIRQTATDTSYYLIDHPCECISDYANSGIDPPQMVSIFVSGGDIGGNQIDGGSSGINEDLVTYIAMDSRVPLVEAFHITDSHGTMLNENNRSIYAGNIYHLLVEGKDPNGWRDIETIRVNMNPQFSSLESSPYYDPDGHTEVFYSPQNDTAWTNSNWIEIIDDYENTGIKPRMLNREGNVLISPFEQQFTLDIPIRMEWSIPMSYVGGVITPDVAMKDKDEGNNEASIAASRSPQRWSYSSGIELDMTSFTVEDTSGFATDGVGTTSGGFVYQGDILVIDGRYVFSAGMNDLIFVSPEIPLTLQVTRTPLYPAGLPDSGYSPAITEVNEYQFENGTFQLVVPAAYATNEYTYTMQLLGLPNGAVDYTPAPSRSFVVKVDGDRPDAVFGSWDLSNSVTGETLEGSISSSIMDCLDAEILIDELQGMDTQSVELNWMFYKTQEVGGFEYNWTEYLSTFEDSQGWESTPMYLESSQGRIRATATCFNLWDNAQPIPDDMENVIVKFWLTGYDSAGQTINGAGSFGSSLNSGAGTYEMAYESSNFVVNRVDLSVDNPMAEEPFDILIDFENAGNKEGQFEVQIVISINGVFQSPVTETSEVCNAKSDCGLWRIEVQPFAEAATNVSIIIKDVENEEIANIPAFNVAKYSDKESDSGSMLLIGIVGVVLVLIVAVVVVLLVLNRSVEDDELEYIEEEDFLPTAQPVTPVRSRGPPGARSRGPPGSSRGPPGASVTKSPMDIAKEKFPFWDEATIQGYFDQGWNVEQLEEWLASQE
ncbi:MAG: hypothetical protein VYA86_05975 [Candidatus Thermoplasmatota archaeon]|nr:hypothetical protein [Candidatus Thermoplasmatota archaeon]